MNISTSECSSGCESGWTMYLDQSSNSQENNRYIQHKNQDFIRYNYKKSACDYLDGCDEEDEDLSMVSDASSGPPHFEEEENNYCCDEIKRIKKKINNKEKRSGKKEQFLYLDDTASSPLKNHMVLPPSGAPMEHGTHHKGKSAFQKHIGFFQSSMSKKSELLGSKDALQGKKRD